MSNIQAITFDAGGTLLYPYPSVGTIYAEVMEAHQLFLDPQKLETSFRRAWKEAHQAPRVGIDNHTEKDWWRAVVRRTLDGLGEPRCFETLFEDLWLIFAEPKRWRLHVGAQETLCVLKERGYRLAILSNWDERLRGLLKGLQIESFFEHFIISCEVGFEKPHASIFRIAEERLGISSNQILHVGDSLYHDQEGAQNAGWLSLLINHQPEVSCSKDEISRLQDLLDCLPLKTKHPLNVGRC